MSNIIINDIPANDFFNFCIEVLADCEASKEWVRLQHRYIYTCGYTGPGIGLIIKIFEHHRINNAESLSRFLHSRGLNKQMFCNAVNETIGNLLDLSAFCPITGVREGVRGLIREEQSKMETETEMEMEVETELSESACKVYKIQEGGANLVSGVNIITFSSEGLNWDTFHHATIYAIPDKDVCYIIDSWVARTQTGTQCRDLTFRRFTFREVIHCIDRIHLHSATLEETYNLMATYFLAHRSLLTNLQYIGPVTVFTINPDFVEHIYGRVEQRIREGQRTAFGKLKRKKTTGKKTNKRRKRPHSRRTKRRIHKR